MLVCGLAPKPNINLEMVGSAQVVVRSLQEAQNVFTITIINPHLAFALLTTHSTQYTLQILSKRLSSLDLAANTREDKRLLNQYKLWQLTDLLLTL